MTEPSQGETANLRTRPTVKQRAAALNVSPRLISMADAVLRLRPDLEGDLMAGRMTVNKAHEIATKANKPTPRDRLVKAWNNASDEDRTWLLAQVISPEKSDP